MWKYELQVHAEYGWVTILTWRAEETPRQGWDFVMRWWNDMGTGLVPCIVAYPPGWTTTEAEEHRNLDAYGEDLPF